jgi:hypothetical protein
VKRVGQKVARATSPGNNIRQSEAWPLWLYSIALWFVVVFALRNRRGYQDSWILEDIVVAVVFLVVAFVLVVAAEKDSGRLALLATSFAVVLRWIPGLKYVWAYGTTTGLALHTDNTHQIMQTGFPPLETAYSNVPGMHVFLSAIALASNTTAEQVVKYAFPVIMGSTPLLIYFLCRQIKLNTSLRNQIIVASTFALDPYFREIEGTSFGALAITILVVWFLIREFGSSSMKLPMTVSLLGTIAVLNFGHAVSGFVLIQLLLITATTLAVLSKATPIKLSREVVPSTRRLLILTSVVFVTWWMYQAKLVYDLFVDHIVAFAIRGEIEKAPIPSRFFQLPPHDALTVLWMMHGNSFIVFLLASIGVIILWRSRHTFLPESRNALMVLFALELGFTFMAVWQLVASFGTLEYGRIVGYAVALSPLFTGVTLWHIHKWNKTVGSVALLTILFLSLSQAFPYQPMVPKGDSLFNNIGQDEPVLYLHTVATYYQADMLAFAKSRSTPNLFMIADKATRDVGKRFWGAEFFRSRRLKYWTGTETTPLDIGDWQVYLLHRPGIAGPFGEPLELRSRAEIDRILSEPGRSLIYSNGESFVLLQP